MNFDEIGKGLAFETNQNLIDENLINFDEIGKELAFEKKAKSDEF